MADVSCSMCGRVPDPELDGDPAMTWTLEMTEPARHICPECTRSHVRAIEAKLDQQWW